MKKEEINEDLNLLKEKLGENFNENVYTILPFFMLHHKIFQSGNEVLINKYDFTRIEIDLLSSLYCSGGDDMILSPKNLASRLLFSSSGMTKVLKRLKDKKFIKRVNNKEDKRSMLVQLSKTGIEIVPKVLKDIFAVEEKCLSSLSKEEKKQFENLLLKTLH